MLVGGSMSQIQKAKRKSILHVQNVFLVNPLSIYYAKQTERYIIGYEPKAFRYHSLVFKVDKKLINEVTNEISIKEQVDINIKEDFRFKIKGTDKGYFNGIRIIMRIVPSRYMSVYNPLYGIVIKMPWKHTGAGGLTELELNIPECPVITNFNTVNGICYKLVSTQRSGGGTHGINTYIIVSDKKGQYEIGKSIRITNMNKSGKQHVYVNPVYINL